jgi:hypothetical protein
MVDYIAVATCPLKPVKGVSFDGRFETLLVLICYWYTAIRKAKIAAGKILLL